MDVKRRALVTCTTRHHLQDAITFHTLDISGMKYGYGASGSMLFLRLNTMGGSRVSVDRSESSRTRGEGADELARGLVHLAGDGVTVHSQESVTQGGSVCL
jgi:hypothetical protein